MPSPDDLRRLADQLEARARELRREAAEADKKMGELLHLPFGDYSRTIGPMETERLNTRRRGPALRSTGPMATAARNANMSMFEIAKILDVTYMSVKHWDRRLNAPEDVKKLLAKKPYLVPLSAWTKK